MNLDHTRRYLTLLFHQLLQLKNTYIQQGCEPVIETGNKEIWYPDERCLLKWCRELDITSKYIICALDPFRLRSAFLLLLLLPETQKEEVGEWIKQKEVKKVRQSS